MALHQPAAPPAGEATDITRDRWGRPLITPEGGGKPVAYTRASTLGGTLEDQFGLGQWRMRQVALGIGRRRDLQIAAAAVQAGDKRKLSEIADAAFEAAESTAAATIGTALHSLTELVDTGRPVPDVGEHAPALEAYREVMSRFEVHGIEQFVVCDRWTAAGTFDRLVSPRGTLVAPDGTVFTPDNRLVLDLKTSSTADYFGIKFAVQLAIYAHGTPYDVAAAARTGWTSVPSSTWALILHCPSGGSSASLHWVDLVYGADLADLACSVRDWRKRKDLVLPASLPDVEPVPVAITQQAVIAMIRKADDRAEIERLYHAHRSIWSTFMNKVAKARVAELAGVSV